MIKTMRGKYLAVLYAACVPIYRAAAGLMPFESVQLETVDIDNFSDLAFGRLPAKNFTEPASKCREFPGSANWPTAEEWVRFNNSLGGALIEALPAGAVCYDGPSYSEGKCQFLLGNASQTRFYLDDPVSVLTIWPTGSTCPPALHPDGHCTLGGMPSYVVNATKVKHIQASVNFARNRNIRLVIKNTGHDFGGRSTGAGALSIWTHHLKDFRFFPEYTLGQYDGPAAQFGAGTESWELRNGATDVNVTVVAPGGYTVGAAGGWFCGGGHTTITSTYGLGSDQALSINVVTADGRLVTADPFTNQDLFFALRGGAGSTFGVITSVTMKAHPPINVTTSSLKFVFDPSPPPTNSSSGNLTVPLDYYVQDVETFWRGVGYYYQFAKSLVDAGGFGFSYVYPLINNSFRFTGSFTLPGKEPQQFQDFTQPLYSQLDNVGIRIPNPEPRASVSYSTHSEAAVAGPNNRRYTSRLFPRSFWEDEDLLQSSMSAIREAIEAGYTFHGTIHGPSEAVAGWPGRDSAVNPAWRVALLHAMLFYKDYDGVQTAAQARESEEEINSHMENWRRLTPGSGAYINEADPAEPNWQQSFFGSHYPRLLEIKRATDPWGIFWAPTTAGSEDWEVQTDDDYPHSQNGRLCRAGTTR